MRVDEMKHGDRFVAVGDGRVWTFDRKDGALSGAYHCTRDDGFRSCFAGCAEGELQPGSRASTGAVLLAARELHETMHRENQPPGLGGFYLLVVTAKDAAALREELSRQVGMPSSSEWTEVTRVLGADKRAVALLHGDVLVVEESV